MRKAVALGLVVALLHIARGGPAPTTAELVSQLISRLGSPAYHEREAACRELDRLGEPALRDLKQATYSGDSETARRAGELVRRIEQRAANARFLAPTQVDVTIIDAPLPDAVRDFGRITGLPVSLGGDGAAMAKLARRRVTFRSGRVSLWEAYGDFMRAAELAEWDGVTPLAGLPTPLAGGQRLDAQAVMIAQAAGGGRVIIRKNRAALPAATRQLWLHDSDGKGSHVFSTGAVRIRVLPAATPLPALALDGDQFAMPLQIGLEPKLTWNGSPLIKSVAAVDDQGQAITATAVRVPDPAYAEDFGEFADGNSGQRNRIVALRVTRGDKPAEAIRELKGTLSLPVRVKGVVVAIDKPVQNPGNPVRGKNGFTLLVEAAQKADNGDVRLNIVLDMPVDAPESLWALNRFGGVVVMPGRRLQAREQRMEFPGFALEDAKGQHYAVETTSPQGDNGGEGVRARLTLICKPPKDAGPPARLTYSASIATALEVPFRLADLPMP